MCLEYKSREINLRELVVNSEGYVTYQPSHNLKYDYSAKRPCDWAPTSLLIAITSKQ